MSLKKYELIRRYFHANDNTTKYKNLIKLFKVEPAVNAVRNKRVINPSISR